MATRKPTTPEIPAQPAEGDAVGANCPICQTQVVRGEPIVRCPSCGLLYHSECWTQNEGCGAYGCEEAPETIKAKAREGEVHWEGEKRCPSCHQKIKAQALVCMHCKARFWTRDPISKEAWQGREYAGSELARVRNVMILVFIASACGCIFPLMAILTGLWIFSGSGPFPYVRLPASLQILLKASFGASVLWAFVLLLVLGLT